MPKQSITVKDILKLAIPAIIAGIAEPVISITDLAVIGRMENGAVVALSAVGLVGSFLSAIIWTLAQTKTSISSIISNALGEDRLDSTKELVPQVIWINIVAGSLIYLITAPLAEWIFTLYQAEGDVLKQAVTYYQIRAIGFPMTLCAFALFGLFRGLQNTSWAMTASLIGAAINVVLDIILVHGIPEIIPAMGIEGAAYASLVAQFSLMCIAIYFLYKKTGFSLALKLWKPHEKLGKHLSLTANFFLRTAAINIAIYLSYRFANGYSTSAAATHAILMNIWLFFSFFIDGFANAGNAIGGRLLGSRDAGGLRYLAKTTLLYGVGVAVILSLGCFALYDQIPLFFTDEAPVLEMMSATFWIVILMQPVNAVAFVYDGIFKGWGEAVYLRNLLIFLTIFVFIPTIYIADYLDWKLKAVWVAFFLWMVGRSAVLHFKFYNKVSAIEEQ
ncbi:MATE family efflux transporter [Nonlabens spongiae]|uniref:Multidrug-efflux transporter n=1 Tax=Nonlabens spongiae TaxID=331648 RepID=A0A1W6ML09_9FLAO|nr:MATE family efflux transporter [Nonlabens spongiae]ARN78273.1 MATE family efflux transporter [Nonlabens spongiae]